MGRNPMVKNYQREPKVNFFDDGGEKGDEHP